MKSASERRRGLVARSVSVRTVTPAASPVSPMKQEFFRLAPSRDGNRILNVNRRSCLPQVCGGANGETGWDELASRVLQYSTSLFHGAHPQASMSFRNSREQRTIAECLGALLAGYLPQLGEFDHAASQSCAFGHRGQLGLVQDMESRLGPRHREPRPLLCSNQLPEEHRLRAQVSTVPSVRIGTQCCQGLGLPSTLVK